jgi:hypothetical protein
MWRKFVVGTEVRFLRADRTVPGSKPAEKVTQYDEDEVMRKSVSSAPVALGYLRRGRGSSCTASGAGSGEDTC